MENVISVVEATEAFATKATLVEKAIDVVTSPYTVGAAAGAAITAGAMYLLQRKARKSLSVKSAMLDAREAERQVQFNTLQEQVDQLLAAQLGTKVPAVNKGADIKSV